MPSWPTNLPQYLLQDGLQIAAQSTNIRTQMDAGVAKVRKRFTSSVEALAGRQILTDAQMIVLRDFYNNDLAAGSLAFDWTHPITDVSAVFRFTEPYQASKRDVYWEVSYSLEILP